MLLRVACPHGIICAARVQLFSVAVANICRSAAHERVLQRLLTLIGEFFLFSIHFSSGSSPGTHTGSRVDKCYCLVNDAQARVVLRRADALMTVLRVDDPSKEKARV